MVRGGRLGLPGQAGPTRGIVEHSLVANPAGIV